VTNHQPFLTGFPTQICGSIRRRLQDVIAARRRALTDSSIATYAMQFSHVLPADFLHKLSVSQRIRQYCNVVVFWAWLAQILEANASLSKAVSLVQAWCADANLPVPGEDTGSYSRGRGRLPIEFLTAANTRINAHLAARIQPQDTYQGHIIKSIDGSSMTLDDTEENQADYPQPSSQKKGCGFPLMGIMGVLNHAHGGWEDFAEGEQSAHDAPIYLKLLHCFHPGDILCGVSWPRKSDHSMAKLSYGGWVRRIDGRSWFLGQGYSSSGGKEGGGCGQADISLPGFGAGSPKSCQSCKVRMVHAIFRVAGDT
jgi:hypothetical protein